MNVVTGIDAIRINARNIPASTPYVFGYGTGTGVVPWTSAEWALFPNGARVVYDQTPDGTVFGTGKADVYDVENLAGLVKNVPGLVRQRIGLGITWSTIYGTDETLKAVKDALDAFRSDPTWYYGHVDVGLADWNLSETEAAAIVGTLVHGMTCRYVQWASPVSNPSTSVPGRPGVTLAAAQVDLNVVDPTWRTGAGSPPPVQYVTVRLPDGVSVRRKSGDILP